MLHDFGHLTLHMAAHIAAMNVIAPLAAWLLRDRFSRRRRIGVALATIFQVGLLFLLHVPAAFTAMIASPALGILLHILLFLAALLFWREVFAGSQSPWRGAVGLLLSGKLVCLLGVLLLFSDRPLYAFHYGKGFATALADQQFAGLLMLIACPLTYVFGATWLVSRWLISIDRRDALAPQSG